MFWCLRRICISGCQVGKMPAAHDAGKMPAAHNAGKMPAAHNAGKMPAVHDAGKMPAAHDAGGDACARWAALAKLLKTIRKAGEYSNTFGFFLDELERIEAVEDAGGFVGAVACV